MPQLDRPPLPSYEELFLTPPRSTSHTSFDTLPGFSTSSSISSSTPRLESAFIGSSSVSCGDSSSHNSEENSSDQKIPIDDGSVCEDANNNDTSNDVEKQGLQKEDSSVISVRERAQKLNKLHSESEPDPSHRNNGSSFLSTTSEHQRSGGRRSVAAGSGDAPVSLTKELRKWMVMSATVNYHPIAKMISENKNLVHFQDLVTGYTPLHWAAKSGQVELIKLIVGNNAPVNSKSNGGYTPLHLAYIQGHKDAVEILKNVYKADPNIRDNTGKQPRKHNPVLAQQLGDIDEIHRPSSTSGISRWGFRTSAPRTGDSKSGWKSNRVERKESRGTDKADFKIEIGGKEKMEDSGKEKWEGRRMKPKKTHPVNGIKAKGLDESDYEKTTQVTFV